MAGKSGKGRNRKGSHNASSASEPAVHSNVPVKDNVEVTLESAKTDAADAAGNSTVANPEVKENETTTEGSQQKQGDLQLYPVSVKTQTGEKLELQLNPGDSVMDVRQFLLDAPETCFITCYDLLLHTKDGSTHHLEDYNEISEVADITTGGCSLEMVPAFYDDRSIRAHVHRTRELLSLSNLHASLSTSLALQNEIAQNKGANSGDTLKPEVPELDGLGYMEDISGSLGNLLSSPLKDIKCVESIVFSSFNPPPSYRRLVGDLIYLDVVTLEGNKFCITGSTKMFYVNSSSANNLDPRPSKATFEATTLVALLQKISPKFKKAFREVLEGRAAAHPFENVQSLLPPNSWLGLYPVPDHRRDAARAENALTLLYGNEPIGMQRDWNEELQSCREFPHTSPQERILRDRALYKVTSDFVDAAINGAIGVISGCIPPINPTDPECFHMYVHNNIFFSFAIDADLEKLPKKRLDANSKSWSSSTLQSSSDKDSIPLHGESQVPNGGKDDSSSSEDLNGTEITQDVSPEAQLAENEQATYASANNDLKGTKAYQEADVPGLYNLAMAIIDYRGHRVVAQSVLPGILQGDKSDSLLYGSVDNGKKICWNEDFHSKVSEAAKCLHLKEHLVLDGSGNFFKLAAPVECKGIVGGDDRHYLLDLLRVTPRDANYTGPGSRFCILRPELITAYCQAQAAEALKSKEKNFQEANSLATESQNAAEADQLVNDSQNATDADKLDSTKEEKAEDVKELASVIAKASDGCEDIVFNPNVFTEFKLAGSPEEIAADEDNVRKVSQYLTDVVLPKFIQDLCTLEVSPMDGQTLTEALHAHGINVRYIGRVAGGTKHLPHLWDLCNSEIVVRSAKHIIKDLLRETEDHDLAPAVSHFLNCLFGSCQAPSGKVPANSTQSNTPKKEHAGQRSPGKHSKGLARWKGRASLRKTQPLYASISSEALWLDIQEFAMVKYKFELPADARSRVKKISLIRNLCLKVGITVAARKYDLSSATPFQTSDVLDLRPVVKHSVPACSEAKELVETGKLQLAEGMLSEAYTLFSEAFSILQQVTGPMHREVANCCRYLAMVLYHAGDMAGAIMQQHKELIINERCLGLDHPDTAHSYGNMALFYHGLNQTELALRHMSRAFLLLSLSSGPDHPDVAATFINVAMMYQDIGKMNTALRYLQEALKKNERLLGEEHIQTAVCYHALAIAFNCMGAFKLSHQHEKKTYDILVKQLGEDDSRTRDSQNWMNTFKMRELQMNAQKQKGQTLNAASAQKAIDILKAHPDLMHAFQAAAIAGGSGSSGASANKSLNAAVMGEALSRGRGIDERAARAAAEVRKKAAARGLSVRPHSVPVQSLPPLTQLLNIINSGVTPDAVDNGNADGAKKEANDIPPSDSIDAKKGQTMPVQEQEHAPVGSHSPVGLGKGLSSLDAKKQKSKPKAGA
ncbi:clustered mitochondria protein-like isoform X2 [Glycine soja]|uniref:Clustered mitochondria protein homolog n=1 Tax=Glycine soja TaxID=3848 RepID=A0A445GZ11_GLYSO|nr:clustered mitochondria protein-like isoform X2 [Glycine soja]RZB66503.1 Clustered mitochondria protein isoform A [Glycine soja]RZB66504.1 Clustered mitochondria protein isoform B [Glycine soja]